MRLPLVFLCAAACACAQGTVTVRLEDFAAVPLSGQFAGSNDNSVYAARVNFLRDEGPFMPDRLFVNDLNGKLYILDRATRRFTTYLDFNRNTAETPGATGLFPAFTRANGYANGLVTFLFDRSYTDRNSPHYGKFYTVHIELDTDDGDVRRLPVASAFPGLTNPAAYAPSTAFEAPGTDNTGTRHAVLVEWQDTDRTDAVFQGTAREILRIEFNGRIHPLGDLLRNPAPLIGGHPDFRTLYLAVGDGGAGEQNNAVLHPTPQRLDVLQGKILRISPDDPDGPGPLRYTVPPDHPFFSLPGGTRPEIWAYGFRNPHRLSWDFNTGLLLAADIGFRSWEEINVVRRAGNYGYGEREGNRVLNLATGLADGALPADDARSRYTYPVIQYPHSPALGYGDAIAGAFIYRGAKIPELQGKLVFGDITTGQLWYADVEDVHAADDDDPATLAPFHRIELLWDNPRDAAGPARYDRMYEIVRDEYRARGGRDPDLPGAATVSDLTGGGRADIRLAVDRDGEFFILSKSDGMIRALSAAPAPARPPVFTRLPAPQTVAAGETVVLVAEAAGAAAYQWKRDGAVLPGATAPQLTLKGSATRAGAYTVEARNAAGTVASPAVRLDLAAPAADRGRIANFSIRSAAGSGAQTLIVGFANDAAGTLPQSLLLRGVGPALGGFGVAGALADPRLELFRGTVRLAENDNWDNNAAVSAAATAVGAFALPAGSRDAAFVQADLAQGAYTAQVTGGGGATGLALAEVFDASVAQTGVRRLANVSARTQVGTGENVLIAGFVLGGTTARTVLIRAAGPVLGTFGVTGVLADPKLTLYRGAAVVAENDNWQSSAELLDTFASAGAFPFVARSRDAALVLLLPPGSYTAHVADAAGTASGVALVEVYVLP